MRASNRRLLNFGMEKEMYLQEKTHSFGVLLVLALLLPFTTNSFAHDSSGFEQSIRQLEKERVQALLRSDTSFIERNYANDYITTGASGLVRNRAEVIADMKSARSSMNR